MIEILNKMIQDNKNIIQTIHAQIKRCDCDDGFRESNHEIFDTIRTLCKCQYYNDNYGKMINDYKKDINRFNDAKSYIDRLQQEYRNIFYDNDKMAALLKSEKINNFFTNKSDKKILFISGDVGIGKTTMLFYLTVRSIMRNIGIPLYKESSFKVEYGQMIIPDYSQYFMIDDLRGTSRHYSNYYYHLFDKIRRSGRKVAFTCNYDVKTWCEKFEKKDDGVRIYDRTKHITEEIKLLGKSKR